MKERDIKTELISTDPPPGQMRHCGTYPKAVRVTHLPTGLSATSVSEQTQIQNRDKALAALTFLVEAHTEPITYSYVPILTDSEDLEQAVFTALGAASMCWDETPKGVFDSTRAKHIGDELVEWVKMGCEGRID